MKYSFWEKHFAESPSMVTILGAGIVGLSTAISIKEENPHITVKILERGHLPTGASTKNAGFSCFGSVSEILDDISVVGESSCMDLVKMRYLGLQKLKLRVGENNMEYQHNFGTELFRGVDSELMEVCLSKVHYCSDLMDDYLGLKDCYRIEKNDKFPKFKSEAILNIHEGTINPMMMMNELQRQAYQLGVHIMYGIEVEKIDRPNHRLFCKNELVIMYEDLIVCTNGFTSDLLPHLDVKPARNQVLITKPLPNNPVRSSFHVDRGYVYFREYQGRILLGGGRNLDIEGETTTEFGHTDRIRQYLIDILETIYPTASKEIDQWWSGILGVGPIKRPIVEWIDDHVLVGVRLGGMGVAIGSYLGEELKDKYFGK